MSLKAAQFLAGLHVPQAEGLLDSPQNLAAIGREDDRAHYFTVTNRQASYYFATLHIPQVLALGHEPSIRRKGDPAPIISKSVKFFPALHVPQVHIPQRSGQDQSAVRRQGGTDDIRVEAIL